MRCYSMTWITPILFELMLPQPAALDNEAPARLGPQAQPLLLLRHKHCLIQGGCLRLGSSILRAREHA